MQAIAKLVGGSFNSDPSTMREKLSKPALELVNLAFENIEEVCDMHTHLGGVGHGNTGCCVNPMMTSPWHPLMNIKYKVFLSASGVSPNSTNADRDYTERLATLIRTIRPLPWGHHFLLAMDRWHDADGTPRPDLTGLYVPNEYMMEVVTKFPDIFMPCVSIHPYRADAITELDKYGRQGVRLVKWLPNSQGMDATSDKCQPFYAKMREHNMILLIHVGEEHSIDAGGLDQSLGNPLKLRGPLDAGVRVIAAHCASEGENVDLDDEARKKKPNFELFLRLMDTPKYNELLFADISAMTAFRRLGVPLTTMLDRPDLHPRLVFGSDYPVPCINLVVQTKALVNHSYITPEERGLLNEIYDFNPLLFDFVTKRCLKSPNSGRRFAACVFNRNTKLLGPKPPAAAAAPPAAATQP